MTVKVIDTNILLDYPSFFTRQKDLSTIVIPYGVIHELEKLKDSQNREVAMSARRAATQIEKYRTEINFGDLEFFESTRTVDNEIIEIAKADINNSIIITNDLCLSLKANIFGIKTGKFSFNEIHSGVVEFNGPMGECDTLYGDLMKGEIPRDLEIYNNEFLVLKAEGVEHSVFKIKNGEPITINSKNYKNFIKNSFCNTVKPKSLEQLFYFDLLSDEDITIISVSGGEGSKIIFDGDIKQADSQLFRNRSGLKLLNQLSKSNEYSKIFGKIQLKQGERSFTATAAEYLDEI